MKIKFLVLFFFLLAQSLTPARPTQAQLDQPETPTTINPPVLKWQNGGCVGSICQTGWYSSPAVADLKKDGKAEVIAGAYSLLIVNGLTGVLSTIVDFGNERIWPDVVVADLNHDGNLEMVTATGGGTINVYANDYGKKWSKKPTNLEFRSLAASDLDGNGNLEVIAASTASNNQWIVYNSDSTIYPSHWPQLTQDTGYAAGCYNENIAAGDLDGDGRAEIIGPNDTHYIDAFNDDGSQILANNKFGTNKFWSQVGVNVDEAADIRGYTICGSENRPNFADSAPIITDLDGDGTLETVVIGNVYNCATNPYTDLYQVPFIFNADRTRWHGSGFDWTVVPTPDSKAAPLSENYNIIQTAEPNPVVADLDGDGRMEILYASYDGRVHAYWLDKTEHGHWPYSVYKPADGFITFASPPVVADLNGDGTAEVIFASWTQLGSYHTGKLYILDYLGNPLQIVDLPQGVGGANWNGALASPTLADIDGDHELEVVLNTANSGLVAYDLPGSQTTGIMWRTGRGSYQRNGMSAENLAASQALVSPRNPAKGATITYTIKLRNPGLSPASANITDTLSAGQFFNAGSLSATSGSANESGGVIYWNGAVGLTPVYITFTETVDPWLTGAARLTSTVLISDNQGSLFQRGTSILANGVYFYLPIAAK